MSIRRYSFWISALIVEFLSKIVKRALSVRPLVREAPEWLMPGRAGWYCHLALLKRAILFGKSAVGPTAAVAECLLLRRCWGLTGRKLEGSRFFYESSSRHPAATKGIETPRRHGEWSPTYYPTWITAAANIDIFVCSYLGVLVLQLSNRPCCGGTPQ